MNATEYHETIQKPTKAKLKKRAQRALKKAGWPTEASEIRKALDQIDVSDLRGVEIYFSKEIRPTYGLTISGRSVSVQAFNGRPVQS